MPEQLPHCDELFLRFLDPWYSELQRKRRGFQATRPDMVQSEEVMGGSGAAAVSLRAKAFVDERQRVETMLRSAREDWPDYLEVSGEVALPWIDAFDRYWDRKHIKEVLDRSDPKDFANDYLVVVCEFGAVLGHVMRNLQPRMAWHLEQPYWESALVDPKTGSVIPVFHWAVKKMSEYGVDDGFAAKVEACLRVLEGNLIS